ncbi:hypothetical protein D3C80_1339360 [compost metagenome]
MPIPTKTLGHSMKILLGPFAHAGLCVIPPARSQILVYMKSFNPSTENLDVKPSPFENKMVSLWIPFIVGILGKYTFPPTFKSPPIVTFLVMDTESLATTVESKRAEPATCRRAFGVVVPIPIFPFSEMTFSCANV